MKYLLAVLALVSLGFAQCPLGFSPEQACSADSPSCGLFADDNADGLCDNPGPQVETESEPEPPADPDPEPELEDPGEADPFCPLGYSPGEACDVSSPGCALFTDGNGDGLCDNPGPQPVVEEIETVETPAEEESVVVEEIEETAETGEEVSESVEESPGEVPGETPSPEDTLAVEEPPVETDEQTQQYTCPLQFTPEEACTEENPFCALYTDADADSRCDNPGTVCLVEDTACGLNTPSIIGCPLGLPPEGACPDSLALCPHWYGVTSNINCANPSGGSRRTNIILITLAVLMSLSTFLSRKFYGRRLKDRLKRSTAHHVIRGVSLMVLGFGVQGCFCPLGTFQYAFTAEGLAFLGFSGLAILLLPMVFSAFFGRVFCGWVCPIGGIQEFLYRIHIPGRVSPSGRFHRKLRYLNHVILFGLIALILLNRFGVLSLRWTAPFCQIDPFHSIFTLFLSGSLIVAGVTIILAIFIRRFFCRYLCFYGAALTQLSKLTLWSRIRGTTEKLPEADSDEEFDK